MTWDEPVQSRVALTGGCICRVERWQLKDGSSVVAKIDPKASGTLLIEARMLDYLAKVADCPSPIVIEASAERLLISDLSGHPGPHDEAGAEIAEALAALHSMTAENFGFPFETVIAELPQTNAWHTSWARFYAEQRLQPMAELAQEAGQLPRDLRRQVDGLCHRIDNELPARPRVSLLHGDLWSGNVLSAGSKLCGLIDPALYFGDAEVELAFMKLFGGFSAACFKRYDQLSPPEPGDRDRRCQVLQVYPLLVHVRLFGGSYVDSLQRLLSELAD